MAQFLISMGAKVDARDDTGNTALHLASSTLEAMEMVKFLVLSGGADVHAVNHADETPLIRAIRDCPPCVPICLIQTCGANINATDENGMTALHHASQHRRDDVVRFLVQECSLDDMNAQTTHMKRQTALHLARGCRMTAKRLIEGGANVDAVDENGQTALHYAVLSNDKDMVQFLIETCHANTNVCDKDGKTALQYTLRHCDETIAECLVDKGNANVNNKDTEGKTLLHCVDSDSLLWLCRRMTKANVHAIDNLGLTPLHYASKSGCVEIVKYLVQARGANVNATSHNGATALHQASARGGLRLIQCLVDTCGANVDLVDHNGMTALHMACLFNGAHIVEHLVVSGHANVNVIDQQGMTALNHACLSNGCWQKSCILIKAGANVGLAIHVHGNDGSSSSNSALHLASSRGRGYLNLVRLFVELPEFGLKEIPRYLTKLSSTTRRASQVSGPTFISKPITRCLPKLKRALHVRATMAVLSWTQTLPCHVR